jgi:protein-L-isoaspartate(D-aspartate) O-methyltransferase
LLAWRSLALLALLATACSAPAPGDQEDVDDWARARRRMVDHQLRPRGITDARVLDAMERVPRHAFGPPAGRADAYADQPLPIGGGQTISQPYIVALMTQLLALRGGEVVLEIGTGSGYQAAVLSLLAERVYTIEIDPGLAASAAERLRAQGHTNVQVRSGDGFLGWPTVAPFDAIIVTAAAPRVAEPLAAQLKDGGRIVAPIGNEDAQQLVHGTKDGGVLKVREVAEVMFVPMTGLIHRPTPSD